VDSGTTLLMLDSPLWAAFLAAVTRRCVGPDQDYPPCPRAGGGGGVESACKVRKILDAKLVQKLGRPQPFLPVFPQECTGQLASSGPT
jgi:hypothetical protein